MRLFIHALGASAGGGLTYLRNVIPHLTARSDIEITLLAGKTAGAAIPSFGNVRMLASGMGEQSALSRFLWEQPARRGNLPKKTKRRDLCWPRRYVQRVPCENVVS